MRTIQEVGMEVLGGHPAPLYFFVGEEYGIKERYMDIIANHYGGKRQVYPKVADLFKFMRSRHLIPPEPQLYIVRYDEDFIASINDTTKSDIAKLKIIGTIVCLYENSKSANKLDKYLGSYTVSIDKVADRFVAGYLKGDFPDLSDRFINLAVRHSANYGQAKNVCRAISAGRPSSFTTMSDDEILDLFGFDKLSTENELKLAVAARDFVRCVSIIDSFSGEMDALVYAILSTMIELEKIHGKKYSDSQLAPHSSRWKLKDIYYMFMNSYNVLLQMRSLSISDTKSVVVSLLALLPYSSIPSQEVFG